MKRQLILFMLAVPACAIAGSLHSTATAFMLQTRNVILSVFHLLAGLPEAGTLLAGGICCFLLAWLFHRLGLRVHAR